MYNQSLGTNRFSMPRFLSFLCLSFPPLPFRQWLAIKDKMIVIIIIIDPSA